MLITSKKYEVIFDVDGDKSVYPINHIIYKLNRDSNIITFFNTTNLYIINELIDNIEVNGTQLTRDNIFDILNILFDANKK